MKKKTYHAQKTVPIIQLVASMVKNKPELADDSKYLLACLSHSIPGLLDPKECINCGASMAQYLIILDINDALLLFSMAKIVRQNMQNGRLPTFTECNKVRVSGEPSIHHTQKCRTTKCSKLGLIARAGNAEWAITERGFAALRGEPVPRCRVTFRGQIIDRPDDMTTLSQVFREHGDKMVLWAQRGKSLKNDHRERFRDYDQSEWVNVSGYQQGKLI